MQYDFGELTVPLPQFKRHDTIVNVPVYMDDRHGNDYIMGAIHFGGEYPGIKDPDLLVDWEMGDSFFFIMARSHMNAHIVKGRGVWKCTLSLVKYNEFRIHPELLLEQWDE